MVIKFMTYSVLVSCQWKVYDCNNCHKCNKCKNYLHRKNSMNQFLIPCNDLLSLRVDPLLRKNLRYEFSTSSYKVNMAFLISYLMIPPLDGHSLHHGSNHKYIHNLMQFSVAFGIIFHIPQYQKYQDSQQRHQHYSPPQFFYSLCIK